MKGWFCSDGTKTWLLCTAAGDPAKGLQFAPVNWGGDVISVQPDGTVKKHPAGPNGDSENFTVQGGFAYCHATNQDGSSYGYRWVPLS